MAVSPRTPMVAPFLTLHNQLQQLQALCQQSNPDGPTLQGTFLAAQQQFQTQVLPLGDHPDASPSLQPILTEMNRTFRLLAMDVTFLQATRQPLKAQQRQQQMVQKLQQLSGFCDAGTQALTDAP